MSITVKNAAGTDVSIATIDDLLAVAATSGKQDAATALLTAISASVDGLEGYTDGIEALLTQLKTQVSLAASETHIGQLGGNTAYVDVTLTLDTAPYAAGDLLADTQPINGAMRINGGTGVLQSVTVVDQDDQKADFKIFLLSANNSLGTENAAPSITDPNAVEILGAPISIAVADYTDLGGVSVAGKDGIGKVVKAAAGGQIIYVAVVNGATAPTYTAGGIKLRFGFLQD